MILQSSLYMFPVSTTPIIRSKQNCNYSLRYCAATSLQRGQASLATLEGGSCTGSVVNNRPTHLLLTTDPVLCEQLRLHLCQLLNLTNHPVQTEYTQYNNSILYHVLYFTNILHFRLLVLTTSNILI